MDKKQIFEGALQSYMDNVGDFDGKDYTDIDEQSMFMSFWIGVEWAKNNVGEQKEQA